MIELPLDIIKNSIEYLSLGDLYEYIKNNNINDLISSNQYNELKTKINFIENNFPSILIDLITMKVLLNANIMEWKNEYIGNTDYIDRIKPIHVKNKISIGLDCYNRAFICLKIQHLESKEEFVCTLFQRYSNLTSTWTHGCHSYKNFIKECGYFLNYNKISHKFFESNIKKLISFEKSNLQLKSDLFQDYLLII